MLFYELLILIILGDILFPLFLFILLFYSTIVLGVIDSTHMRACVSSKNQIPFIGRKDVPT